MHIYKIRPIGLEIKKVQIFSAGNSNRSKGISMQFHFFSWLPIGKLFTVLARLWPYVAMSHIYLLTVTIIVLADSMLR